MELTPRDRQVIGTIERIRDQHHACTAAAVAAHLKISKAYMSEVMHDMITNGLLTFSREVPGSLRLTDTARAELFPAEAATADRDVLTCDECDWPTAKALEMHRRRSHA